MAPASGLEVGLQFHAVDGWQPARDVAGRFVRPRDDRTRTVVGSRLGDEHGPRLPPRPVVSTRRGEIPRQDRRVPVDCCRTWNLDDARPLRRGLESGTGVRSTTRAPAPLAQFDLDAESGPGLRVRRVTVG